MSAGTVLRYKGEGNEQYKLPSTDLVITLVDEKSDENISEVAK
jgi:hypothetical protein